RRGQVLWRNAKSPHDERGEYHGGRESNQARGRKDEHCRRGHVAGVVMVCLRMEFGDVSGDRASNAQVQEPEITSKGQNEGPDTVSRIPQMAYDIRRQEEIDTHCKDVGAPVRSHVPYYSWFGDDGCCSLWTHGRFGQANLIRMRLFRARYWPFAVLPIK